MAETLQIDEVLHVLTLEQCDALIDQHVDALVPSTVYGYAPGVRRRSAARTSSSAQVDLHAVSDDIREVLRDSVTAVCGLPPENFEPWQVVRYRKGEQFTSHHDMLPPDAYGIRAYSALFYLRAPEAGGETVFPYVGRTIKPQPGMLVVWPNTSNGVTLRAATHQSNVVTAGEKWSLVTWVRSKPFLG